MLTKMWGGGGLSLDTLVGKVGKVYPLPVIIVRKVVFMSPSDGCSMDLQLINCFTNND